MPFLLPLSLLQNICTFQGGCAPPVPRYSHTLPLPRKRIHVEVGRLDLQYNHYNYLWGL
ncbi:hypothetical protein BC826DRAFT_1040994 [Russula brevipes]|nr:hypothetical protein BC826DRAFT_1040994 [Russula brevipes]